MRRAGRRISARARATAACSALLLLLLGPSVACRDRPRDRAQLLVVDLLRHFKDAERRPAGGRFEFREHTLAGRSRASLIVPPASRMIYSLFVPHRATLRVYAAVLSPGGPSAAAVRIGISDGRRYDHLREQAVTSGDSAIDWVPVEADLSFYAGRKWSLFYRPDAIRWEIVVGTYIVSGAPEGVVLGEPGLYADVDSAREYRERPVVSTVVPRPPSSAAPQSRIQASSTR